MLMNNPLVQSPGWWSLPKKKRFEMASAQSMLSPLAQVRTPQYDYTMDASAGSPAKKKGLSMSNMIKALSEMKKPADLKAPGAKLMGEARPQLPGPPPFAPLGGVNQSIMNTGGLPGDRNKKWWEIMGYS